MTIMKKEYKNCKRRYAAPLTRVFHVSPTAIIAESEPVPEEVSDAPGWEEEELGEGFGFDD